MGKSELDAFSDVFAQADLAEAVGLDGVWLAERHFASSDRGQPSIASAPIILATAIAARTRRLRVGTGVYVLPLNIRFASPKKSPPWTMSARAALPSASAAAASPQPMKAMAMPTGSRERLQECLMSWCRPDPGALVHRQILPVSRCVRDPEAAAKPHPPIYMAATTSESFPIAGQKGRHLVVGVRRNSIPGVKHSIGIYRQAWQDAGHPGQGDVTLRMPVYVGDTHAQAIADPQASTCSTTAACLTV